MWSTTTTVGAVLRLVAGAALIYLGGWLSFEAQPMQGQSGGIVIFTGLMLSGFYLVLNGFGNLLAILLVESPRFIYNAIPRIRDLIIGPEKVRQREQAQHNYNLFLFAIKGGLFGLPSPSQTQWQLLTAYYHDVTKTAIIWR